MTEPRHVYPGGVLPQDLCRERENVSPETTVPNWVPIKALDPSCNEWAPLAEYTPWSGIEKKSKAGLPDNVLR